MTIASRPSRLLAGARNLAAALRGRAVPVRESGRFRSASLRVRMAGMVGAGFLCAATVTGAVLWNLSDNVQQDAAKEAASIARTLSDQLVFQEDRQAGRSANERTGRMQSLLDYVHEREQRDLEIIAIDGTILADSDHGDIGVRLDGEPGRAVAATLRDGQPRHYIERGDDHPEGLYQVTVAMTGARGETIGALVYDYSEMRAEAAEHARAATWRFVQIALPLALLVLLLAVRSMQPVLRSIGRLSEAAAAIGRGERGARVGSRGGDELGDLARAFDSMAGQLESSQTQLLQEIDRRRETEQSLQLANETLEQRVAERTTNLRLVNDRLQSELAERARVEQQLARIARFDSLTGLPNRAMLMQHLERALAVARPGSGKRVAMMFVDVDRFKSINDSFGHEVGDGVLQQTALRLRTVAESVGLGIVYRHAGDEFSIVAEDESGQADFEAFAARLVQAFQPPLALGGGQEIRVTLSIGVAVAPDDATELSELMRRADFAMYYAKSEGRNCFRMHSEQMSDESSARLEIEYALREALGRQEFSLHYQPRVAADDGRLVGLEALLRWDSAVLGRVPPDTFIPVAEDTGLIGEIGDWVIRNSLEQVVAWRREGLDPGIIAINISAGQLRSKDFPERVLAAATLAGVPPDLVELELTESMLVADPEAASLLLETLRGYGFGIAIDDFGKGHSSLMHLKRFPVTRLKIDRAFVAGIAGSQDDAAIAASIVALGNALDVQITAEGVETREQLAVLADLRCSEYQGFLFGRPVDAGAIADVLRRQPTV